MTSFRTLSKTPPLAYSSRYQTPLVVNFHGDKIKHHFRKKKSFEKRTFITRSPITAADTQEHPIGKLQAHRRALKKSAVRQKKKRKQAASIPLKIPGHEMNLSLASSVVYTSSSSTASAGLFPNGHSTATLLYFPIGDSRRGGSRLLLLDDVGERAQINYT